MEKTKKKTIEQSRLDG